jgi:hypothetical protein
MHRLGIRCAEMAGVISVFRPIGAAPQAIGMPYIVFAGNIGRDQTLAQVVANPQRRPAGPLTHAAPPSADQLVTMRSCLGQLQLGSGAL